MINSLSLAAGANQERALIDRVAFVRILVGLPLKRPTIVLARAFFQVIFKSDY